MKKHTFSLLLAACIATLCISCSSIRVIKTDPELKQTSALADAAFGAGNWSRSAALYKRSLARARQMDRPAEVAAQAYALAACHANMAQWAAAAELLDEAALEAVRAGTDSFDIRLLRAKTAFWQSRPTEARAMASKLLPASNTIREAQIRILLGQLACDSGDLALARSEMKNAGPLLRRVKSPGILADWAGLRAGIALLEGSYTEAANAFDEAAAHLQAAARYYEMALMLERAGTAFAKAGDKQRALDRSFRAARSLTAGGHVKRAQAALQLAKALAAAIKDPLIMRNIEALTLELDSLSKDQEQPKQ